eukprot:SAG22_NODE_942_length_6401_cov_9.094000_1_plen_475_part_00
MDVLREAETAVFRPVPPGRVVTPDERRPPLPGGGRAGLLAPGRSTSGMHHEELDQLSSNLAKSAHDLHRSSSLKRTNSILRGQEMAKSADFQAGAGKLGNWRKLRAYTRSGMNVKDDLDDLRSILGEVSKNKHERAEDGLYKSSKASADNELAAEQACCLIEPKGTFVLVWDLSQILMLLYVAIMVPLRLGFGLSQPPIGSFKWFAELFVDVYFFCDFFLNFRLAYVDQDRNVVHSLPKITRRYLRGWFAIDLVSVLPAVIGYVMQAQSEDEISAVGGGMADQGTSNDFKALKILRCVRAWLRAGGQARGPARTAARARTATPAPPTVCACALLQGPCLLPCWPHTHTHTRARAHTHTHKHKHAHTHTHTHTHTQTRTHTHTKQDAALGQAAAAVEAAAADGEVCGRARRHDLDPETARGGRGDALPLARELLLVVLRRLRPDEPAERLGPHGSRREPRAVPQPEPQRRRVHGL